jgi:hypothetical protein
MILELICKNTTLKKLRKSGRKSGMTPIFLKPKITPRKRSFIFS